MGDISSVGSVKFEKFDKSVNALFNLVVALESVEVAVYTGDDIGVVTAVVVPPSCSVVAVVVVPLLVSVVAVAVAVRVLFLACPSGSAPTDHVGVSLRRGGNDET